MHAPLEWTKGEHTNQHNKRRTTIQIN